MKKRIGVLALVCAALWTAAPARANGDCVYFGVTAPVLGTVQGNPCPIGTSNTHWIAPGVCETVPQIGAHACVSVIIYTD